jgi:hypothetical protein
MMQTREETNTEASLLNPPLAVPLATLSTSNAARTRMSHICSAVPENGSLQKLNRKICSQIREL